MWAETLRSPLKCTVVLIYSNRSYLCRAKIFTAKKEKKKQKKASFIGDVGPCSEKS